MKVIVERGDQDQFRESFVNERDPEGGRPKTEFKVTVSRFVQDHQKSSSGTVIEKSPRVTEIRKSKESRFCLS